MLFPILFVILFALSNTEAAFIDADAALFQKKREMLVSKAALAFQIKDDFILLLADIDTLRNSKKLKIPLETAASEFSQLSINDIDKIQGVIDKISKPAQEISQEVIRIRNKFISLQQAAVSLASAQLDPAENSNSAILDPLNDLLFSPSNELTASVNSYLQYAKCMGEAALLTDSIKEYLRFADTIKKYGDKTAENMLDGARDSLNRYLSLLERLNPMQETATSLKAFASYKDSLIDRISFPQYLALGKPWKDSIKTYIEKRNTLRTCLENGESKECDRLRSEISGYERFRDTIAKYAATPEKLMEITSSTAPVGSALAAIKNEQSLEELATQTIAPLCKSLMPQNGTITVNGVIKYLRYSAQVRNIAAIQKELLLTTLVQAEREKLNNKLILLNNYRDSLKLIQRFRDSLILRLPIPAWVGEGMSWRDSLTHFTIIRDSLFLIEKELLSGTANRSETEVSMAKYRDLFEGHKRFIDTIAKIMDSPDELVKHTPLASLLSSGSSEKIQIVKKLQSEGAVALLAFAGDRCNSLSAMTSILGNISTIQNSVEELLNGKKSAADLAISAGTSICNTFFADKADLITGVQEYFKSKASIKELEELTALRSKYTVYEDAIRAYGNDAELYLSANGRDSLKSIKAICQRIDLLNTLASAARANAHYLDSLIVRLPIPEWVGEGTVWQDSIRQYAVLRDSIRALQQQLTTLTNSTERSALEAAIQSLIAGKFAKYSRFHEVLKEIISAQEGLAEHTSISKLLESNSGQFDKLREALENNGVITLMAFAGDAVSSPLLSALTGPLAGLLAFQDSLTHYMETVKKIKTDFDTFTVLYQDPFRLIDRVPILKNIIGSLGIDISVLTFPPINNLMGEVKRVIDPYFSRVEELLNFGNEIKTMAAEIPGREAFFKSFVESLEQNAINLRGKKIIANGLVIVSKNEETIKHDKFELFYSSQTCRFTNTVKVDNTAVSESTLQTNYVINYNNKHFLSHGKAITSHEIEGGSESEVVEVNIDKSDMDPWEREGIRLFSTALLTEIIQPVKKNGDIEVVKEGGLIGFKIRDNGWTIFFNKTLSSPLPVRVITTLLHADITMLPKQPAPIVSSITMKPINDAENFIQWSINKDGVKIE